MRDVQSSPYAVWVCTGVVLALSAGAYAEGGATALTLPEALALVLERNPRLTAYSYELRATEAEIVQADVRPNPVLSAEIEEIRPGSAATSSTTTGRSGSAAFTGGAAWGVVPGLSYTRERQIGGTSVFGAAEVTISVSQVIELGGKRAARVRLARADRDAGRWDYEIARADVLTLAAQRFLDALSAQRRIALARELVDVADDVVQTVSDLVDAGKVSPLELPRTEVVRDELTIGVASAERELRAAYAGLAALWGDAAAAPRPLEGRVDDVAALPDLETLFARAKESPDVVRWQAEVARAEAAIGLERATAKPDLEAFVGVRARGLESTGAEAVTLGFDGIGYDHARTRPDDAVEWTVAAGVSMALPVFDRRVGAIEAAEHRAARVGEDRREALAAVGAAIAGAHQEASTRYAEATTLATKVLPKAEEVYALVREGYELGKFDYLEALDAARSLVEARTRLFDARVAWHSAYLELGRLLGEPALDYAHTDGGAQEEINDAQD